MKDFFLAGFSLLALLPAAGHPLFKELLTSHQE
jgi:hypothetical protein